jgi:hypothetical protein
MVGSMPSFLSINSFNFLFAFPLVSVCEEKYSTRNLVSRTSFKLIFFAELINFFVYFFRSSILSIDSRHFQEFWYRLEEDSFFCDFYEEVVAFFDAELLPNFEGNSDLSSPFNFYNISINMP